MNRSIYVGERLDRNLRSIAVESVILVILGVVMFAVNLVQHDWATSLSPLTFVVVGALDFFLVRVKRNRKAAVIAASLAILGVMTCDVLLVDNGFAYLWTLLIPLSVCYLHGIKDGILLTAYFQLLFTVLFYTPLRQLMAGGYSEVVLDRFPLLYFFNGLITIFVMYEHHKSILFEIDHANRLSREIRAQRQYARESAGKVERLSLETVEALAKTIDAKDRYTNGHSFRVARFAVALAEQLGWDEREIDLLRREALLHDVGKIGVPDAVLNKPGALTETEYAEIKQHTTIGREILVGLEGMGSFADVAYYHHERYDGKGYPTGLSGRSIPEHARVVSIADAYDAMSSDRIYRSAFPREKIVSEFEREQGRQFDPEFTKVFLRMIHQGEV